METSTSGEARSTSRLAPFAAILVQFGLIVLLVDHWQVEGLSLARLMQLALAGFVIHHFLPLRFRLPFFAVLSIVATIMVLGQIGPQTLFGGLTGKVPFNNFLYALLPGATVIGIGLALIGMCHLPIPLGARVGLLLASGVGLAVIRANSQWFPDVTGVWVILGSMFVFRLMVYLYDLKHRTAPFSPARAVSYFFMLPNVCFPLFPLVDYKTFCSTYYNEDWPRVYQTGLHWMLRGVFQLLLYQVVYQFAPLDVAKLSSTLDVAGFMLGTYLLYLHVSGQFHLITGLLHMFGFNLPETHHLYLLASSFTDFWRRINIYWKDFIMKLFFYPLFFAMRKIGTIRAMTLATLATFFLTWLLHSWQWFWIRGSFLFTWQDISFWAILALLVLVNALYEATRGRQRKLTQSRITMKERLILGLKTIGTFAVICCLWTLWSCQSGDELKALADAASQPTLREIAIIILGLAALGACGMVWGRSSRETSEGRPAQATRPPFQFWRSALAAGAGAACLLAVPWAATQVTPGAERMLASIRHDALNARDLKMHRRGYYEELDQGRADAGQARQVKKPKGWADGAKVFYRERPDFLLTEITPSVSTLLSGAPATSNRLGMRDREYERRKPANTYRMVLLGASHELGTGVKDNETFEHLVEARLNSEAADSLQGHWEILNMALGGHSLLQKLLVLEQIGFEFQPDAAMFCVHSVEWEFIVQHLRKSLRQGITPPPEYRELVEGIYRKAGVHGKMADLMIERRLRPHVDEVCHWVFQRFAEQCSTRGIRPLVVFRPAPVDLDGVDSIGRDELLQFARAAGLEVIDLSKAFDAVKDRRTLILASWDGHANALGHRLLADKLYEGLTPFLPSNQSSLNSGSR